MVPRRVRQTVFLTYQATTIAHAQVQSTKRSIISFSRRSFKVTNQSGLSPIGSCSVDPHATFLLKVRTALTSLFLQLPSYLLPENVPRISVNRECQTLIFILGVSGTNPNENSLLDCMWSDGLFVLAVELLDPLTCPASNPTTSFLCSSRDMCTYPVPAHGVHTPRI